MKQCPQCGAHALESQSVCGCGYSFPPVSEDPTRPRPPFSFIGTIVALFLPLIGYQILTATTRESRFNYFAGCAIFAFWFFLLSVPVWRATSHKPMLAMAALALCFLRVASLALGVLGAACSMAKPAP